MPKIILAVPLLTGGGAERVVSVWANELVELDYDVTILLFTRSQNEYEINPKIKVLSLESNLLDYKSNSILKNILSIRKILRESKAEFIVSFLPAMQVLVMLACIGLKTKRIETIRVNPWENGLKSKINVFMWNLSFYTSYKIIIQSDRQKEYFKKIIWDKCYKIVNPISDTYIDVYRETTREKVTNFISVGRIDKQKNYEMLIKAFSSICKKYPNIKLDIFGDGTEGYTKEIYKLILSLKAENNIFLRGRTKNIVNEYMKNDVYIMTSNFEGLPNALIEAMACKLICISTDCLTGPSDLIDDNENGFLVSVGNIEQLEQVIEKILGMDLPQLEKISNNARNKVLNCCCKKNSIEKIIDILK